jgi:hypothetical protein
MYSNWKIILGFLFVIAAFGAADSHAQKSRWGRDKRNVFSVNGGYSLPVGKFASQAFDDPRAGMADAGVFGAVNYERKLSDFFGIRLSAVHNINRTNADPLVQKANELVWMYGPLIGETGTYSWESQTSNWKMSSLMFGPAMYIPIGPIEVEAHIQTGKLFASSPDATLYGTSTSSNNPITAQMFSIDANNWGIGGGVSLRVALGPSAQLHFFGDALAADMDFKDIALHGKVGSFDVSQQISEKRAVGVINAGIGLAFRF